MKRVNIILYDFAADLSGDVIGVDYGAAVCAALKIRMTVACGDFDSVQSHQMKAIKHSAQTVITLDSDKDQTDFEFALSLCAGYDEIYVFGALGGRKDHEYLNVMMAMLDERIVLIDDTNRIQMFAEGKHTIFRLHFHYLSLLVVESGSISLEQVRYQLLDHDVFVYDRYLTSNEFLTDSASLIVHQGKVLVVLSKDSTKKRA